MFRFALVLSLGKTGETGASEPTVFDAKAAKLVIVDPAGQAGFFVFSPNSHCMFSFSCSQLIYFLDCPKYKSDYLKSQAPFVG